jgi:hypothetical protein
MQHNETDESFHDTPPPVKEEINPYLGFPKTDGSVRGWNIKDMIEFILSPNELVSNDGISNFMPIHRVWANKLRLHPQFEKFGHIEESQSASGKIYMLYRRVDYDNLYRNKMLARKKNEIQTIRHLQFEERLNRCLDRILKWYPNLSKDKSLAIMLIKTWVEDYKTNEESMDMLNKFHYFDGMEDDEQQIEQLNQEMKEMAERMNHLNF